MLTTLALFGFGQKGWGALLLLGLGVTLAVTASALLIGAVFGALVAWAKLSGSRAARLLGEVPRRRAPGFHHPRQGLGVLDARHRGEGGPDRGERQPDLIGRQVRADESGRGG